MSRYLLLPQMMANWKMTDMKSTMPLQILHPFLCKATLHVKFSWRCTTAVFVFPSRLLYSGSVPPHTYRLCLWLAQLSQTYFSNLHKVAYPSYQILQHIFLDIFGECLLWTLYVNQSSREFRTSDQPSCLIHMFSREGKLLATVTNAMVLIIQSVYIECAVKKIQLTNLLPTVLG